MSIPTHIAIAPDGNGRWARERGLEPHEGHLAGALPIIKTIEQCLDFGVSYVTFQIFTTENWGRSDREIEKLFGAIASRMDFILASATRLDAKVRWIGRRDRVPVALKKHVEEVERETADNQAITVSFCMDYGSYQELIEVMRSVEVDVKHGKTIEYNKELIDSRLQTAGLPDVDLYIRTSGEQRFSNYLLWQCAYAEMYFVKDLWPDFTPQHLSEALNHYGTRHRRFGAAKYPNAN